MTMVVAPHKSAKAKGQTKPDQGGRARRSAAKPAPGAGAQSAGA